MIDYLSVQDGKVLFGKPGTPVSGKERNIRVGDCGGGKTTLCHASILLLPIYRVRKKDTCVTMCCAGWRGAFRPVTVNGRSNQLSGFCGWPCEGSGGNGTKVPQTKDYPVSHGKAPKRKITVGKNG